MSDTDIPRPLWIAIVIAVIVMTAFMGLASAIETERANRERVHYIIVVDQP